MKFLINIKMLTILAVMSVFTVYFAGCSETVSDDETDDQYIQRLVTGGETSYNGEDDNLMANEINDLDDGGAVPNSGSGGDTPIDSLMKWGRKIVSISKTCTITNEGDSLKNVLITTNITGDYIIIGTIGGVVDTVVKRYTEEFKRMAIFKRVNRTDKPRHNWRLYKVSMLDGETKTPQVGSQYVQMNLVQVYINGVLAYTLTGPDFTQNVFTTKFCGGNGIPEVNHGDQVRIVVNTFSTQPEQDIVAWHWGKRNFGFHREPFTMTLQTPNGLGYDRVYEKTFTINGGHNVGKFNGCISASTWKSLHDDSTTEFASDEIGTPYRVRP